MLAKEAPALPKMEVDRYCIQFSFTLRYEMRGSAIRCDTSIRAASLSSTTTLCEVISNANGSKQAQRKLTCSVVYA